MRVLVFSDSHGSNYNLRKVLDTATADYLIFLGDGLREVQNLMQSYPHIKFLAVKGNCDFDPEAIETDLVTIGGIRILYTHGHNFNVRYTTKTLEDAARKINADIVLYGHTHIAEKTYSDGLYIINPGSCSKSREGGNSYAALDIENGQVLPSIIKLSLI